MANLTPDFCIMAHGGASAYAPANTHEAFSMSVTQGAHMIETDVRVTRDGVLILYHDPYCDEHLVSESDYAELKSRCRDLVRVKDAIKDFGRALPFCWEVKVPGIEAKIWEELCGWPADYRRSEAQFTSFSLRSLARLRSVVHGNTLGHLRTSASASDLALLVETEIGQVCLPATEILTDPDTMREAAAFDLQVRAWDVGQPAVLRELATLGVAGATVDWPDLARAALAQRESPT